MDRKILILCNPNQTISVNDFTCKANENGMVELSVQELLVSEDRGLREFDRIISDELGDKQKTLFYEMILSCNRFGLNEVMGLLALEKHEARDLLLLAFKNRLIKKYDTQWRTEHGAKEELRAFVLSKKRQGMIKERDSKISPLVSSHVRNSIHARNEESDSEGTETEEVVAVGSRKTSFKKKPQMKKGR